MRREWPEREAEVSNIIILYRNLLFNHYCLLLSSTGRREWTRK